MAKSFGKKRSTGGKSRYVKKKAGAKVAKRGGSMSASRMKTIVAGEVQKVLNSGAHHERRKVTMELLIEEKQVFVNGKESLRNCIRIPITEAIPTQQGSECAPDVRRRRANKIVITRVNVRASLSTSDETRVMLVPYEPHESVRAYLEKVPLETVPSARHGRVPEGFRTEMVSFHSVGLVSEHGPLMTKKLGNVLALDTADDTPFESRISTHGGKPIGPVVRKKYGGGGLRRTVNWNQASSPVGLGYTAWSTYMLNEYWKLNRECTYMYEGMNRQVFERNVEMFMYIDCPSLESRDIPESQPLVGAVIRKVVVDIYFRDK